MKYIKCSQQTKGRMALSLVPTNYTAPFDFPRSPDKQKPRHIPAAGLHINPWAE